MTFPPCFDSLQDYQAWEKALEDCNIYEVGHVKPNYCSDCLPEYQKKMIEQNRCGYPTVRFFKNGPRAYYGRRIYEKDPSK